MQQSMRFCYVLKPDKFAAVCIIPVIVSAEVGVDGNEEGVCNGDDRFSAERINKNKVKMAPHYLKKY